MTLDGEVFIAAGGWMFQHGRVVDKVTNTERPFVVVNLRCKFGYLRRDESALVLVPAEYCNAVDREIETRARRLRRAA